MLNTIREPSRILKNQPEDRGLWIGGLTFFPIHLYILHEAINRIVRLSLETRIDSSFCYCPLNTGFKVIKPQFAEICHFISPSVIANSNFRGKIYSPTAAIANEGTGFLRFGRAIIRKSPSEKVRKSKNGRRVFAVAGFGPLIEISTSFTPFFGDSRLISRMAGGILSQIYGKDLMGKEKI